MWGAPSPTPPESRPLPRPPEGPACSDLLFYFFTFFLAPFFTFFLAPVKKIPGNFLTGARSIDPAPVKKIPGKCPGRCTVKLIYGDFCPRRIQIFNFHLHRLGKFPGIFFTGAGSNDPAPNGFVLLHLQKMINKSNLVPTGTELITIEHHNEKNMEKYNYI